MDDDAVTAQEPHVFLVGGEDRDISMLPQRHGSEGSVSGVLVPVKAGCLQEESSYRL
ncbi:hypothetical protein [Kitasatospora azatica]|uniref:hypothetical protein n=1 Tax=Kitasatospora azatica TaxID=58347 RepID=UPI000A7B7AAD|nr:hypothetical protein [Kitasatospora azatica]